MRLTSLSAIFRHWSPGRPCSQHKRFRRGRVWVRCHWLWWAILVVLCLFTRPAHPTLAAALPLSSRSGIGPQIALAQDAPAAPHAAQAANDCGVTDLTSCINDWITNFTKHTVADWIQGQVDTFEAYGFIFQTPDGLTYHAPPVEAVYRFSLSVVGVLLTFILAVAGINHMLGRSTAWAETVQQVIFCGIMAFAFQPFIGEFIQLGNDFSFGVQFVLNALPTFPAYGAAENAFMDVVAFIFEMLGDLLLALEALIRLALLDVLIALAPIGILCYALPQSRAWGKMWAEAFVATILIQPLQATLIMLGAKMISLLVTLLGVELPPIVQILVGLASLSVALQVPKMLLSRATHVVADFQREIAMVGASMAARAA